METAAQSCDPEIAEELLKFFVEQKERECFAASLFTCYDLIKPDVALEVCFTFFCQSSLCNVLCCFSALFDNLSFSLSCKVSASEVHYMLWRHFWAQT